MTKTDNLPATTEQMLPGAVQEIPDDIKEEMCDTFFSMRLMAPLSEAVMAGNVEAGNWAVINGDKCIANLGKHPTVIPVAYTRKALDISDEENVRVSHDGNTELYKAIKADIPSNPKKIFAGIEYLMYIDGYGYAPYYCASVSAKKSVQDSLGRSIKKVITLGVGLVKKGHTYHVPAVELNSAIINPPTEEDVAKAIADWRASHQASESRASDKVEGKGDR